MNMINEALRYMPEDESGIEYTLDTENLHYDANNGTILLKNNGFGEISKDAFMDAVTELKLSNFFKATPDGVLYSGWDVENDPLHDTKHIQKVVDKAAVMIDHEYVDSGNMSDIDTWKNFISLDDVDGGRETFDAVNTFVYQFTDLKDAKEMDVWIKQNTTGFKKGITPVVGKTYAVLKDTNDAEQYGPEGETLEILEIPGDGWYEATYSNPYDEGETSRHIDVFKNSWVKEIK